MAICMLVFTYWAGWLKNDKMQALENIGSDEKVRVVVCACACACVCICMCVCVCVCARVRALKFACAEVRMCVCVQGTVSVVAL